MKFYVEELELFGNEATNPYGSVTAGEGVLRFNDVITAPSGTLGSGGLLYVSGTSLYFYDDAGTATDLTAGGASPGGSGTEFQYRVDASTFGGIGSVNTNDNAYAIGGGTGATTGIAGALAFGYLAGNVNTGTYSAYAISIGYQANYFTGAENIGAQSIAIGYIAKASHTSSIAIGDQASTSANYSIAMGYQASAAAQDGLAIGYTAEAINTGSIAIGRRAGNINTGTYNTHAISIGYQANYTTGTENIGVGSITIGRETRSTGSNQISIGAYAGYNSTGNDYAISLGYNVNSSVTVGLQSIAIGNSAITTGTYSIAIGRTAEAPSNFSVSIGNSAGNVAGTNGVNSTSIGDHSNNWTTSRNVGQYSTAVGSYAYTESTGSIALGYQAGYLSSATPGTYNTYAISIGYNSNYTPTASEGIGQFSVALGYYAKARAIDTIAIGDQAEAWAADQISMGYSAGQTMGTSNADAISIGNESNYWSASRNIGNGSVSIGSFSKVEGLGGIALGYQAGHLNNVTPGTYGVYAITLGFQANYTTSASIPIGNYSVAIGYQAIGQAQYQISIGGLAGSTSGTKNEAGISIGYGANDGSGDIGTGAIAIGRDALSKGTASISIGRLAGSASGTDGGDTIQIGYNAGGGSSGITNIGYGSIGIGYTVKMGGQYSIAMGYQAGLLNNVTPGTYNDYAISIGYRANYTTGTENIGAYAITIGYTASGIASDTIVLGREALGGAIRNIAIGYRASNTGGTINADSISIGGQSNYFSDSRNIGTNSIAIGQLSQTTSDGAIAIGYSAGRLSNATPGTYNTYAISIGYLANFSSSASINIGQYAIAIGYQTVTEDSHGIAIGYIAKSQGIGAIAIGQQAGNTITTYNGSAVSIGYQTNFNQTAIGSGSVAVGAFSKSKGNSSISVGYQAGKTAGTDSGYTISIGRDANYWTASNIIGLYSVAIGYLAKSRGTSQVAIGYQAAYQSNATIGNAGSYGVSIGHASNYSSTASVNIGQYTVALGAFTGTTADNGIAIGRHMTTSASGAIHMGYGTTATDNATVNSLALTWNGTTRFNLVEDTTNGGYLRITGSTNHGRLRFNPSTNKLQFSNDDGSSYNDIPTAAGGGAWTESGNDVYWESATSSGRAIGGDLGLSTQMAWMIQIPEVGSNLTRLIATTSDTTAGLAATNIISEIRSTITQADPSALKGQMQFYVNTGDTLTNAMTIDDAGNVGIGTTPSFNLDVLPPASGDMILAGGDLNAGTRTNVTRKYFRFGVPHYTNAEEPVGAFTVDSDSAASYLNLGGGSTNVNAVTDIRFYTAANTTTTTGTLRMQIDESGQIGINSTPVTDYALYVMKPSGNGRVGFRPFTTAPAGAPAATYAGVSDDALIELISSNTTQRGFISLSTFGSGVRMWLQAMSTGNATGPIVLNPVSTGNMVGIGEPDPQAQLHITDDTAGQMTSIRLDNTDATSGSGMSLDYYDGSTNRGYWRYTAASAYFDIGVVHDNGQFRVVMGSTTPTTIISVDNVSNNHDTAIDANLRVAPSAVWTTAQNSIVGAIHLDTSGTAGSGNLGGGISWSPVAGSGSVKRAALISYQNGTDPDNVGLRVYGHSNTSTDPLTALIDFDISGVYSRVNIYPITDSTGANGEDLGGTSNDWRDAYVYNGVTTGSDIRRKDWEFLDLGYETMMMINPIVYSWKSEKDKTAVHFGFSAQEIEQRVKGRYTNWQGIVIGEDEFYRLKEKQLLPILWKGTQEGFQMINKRLDERDERIAELEARVAELENA